jgi:enamine deaminase RidA (YjgF/YER057c/UK114 family)
MTDESSFFWSRWPSYVTAGPFLFFSGQMGLRPGSDSMCTRFEHAGDDARPSSGFPWVAGMEAPVGAQAIAIFERYRAMLKAEAGDLSNLLRYHIYQRDKKFFSVLDRTRRALEGAPPASTAVGIRRFEQTDTATLCVDAVALRPSAAATFGGREVRSGSPGHAPPAHFSHVIGAGHFLFIAGQVPVDSAQPGSPLIRNYDDIPEQGWFLRVGPGPEDARNGPIAAQTWFTYDLIRQHLEAAGSSMDSILNLIVYLQDIRDFPTFHRVHERFFGSAPPTLTVIEAKEVGHKGTLIEIEPTAIVSGPGVKRTIINPKDWRAPAQMSALVVADGLAFLSGVVGVDAAGTPIFSAEALPPALRAEATGEITASACALQSLAALSELIQRLAAADRKLSDVTHLTVYLDDFTEFRLVERVLAKALGKWRPALTVLEVPAAAPVSGARVSLTAIAWCGEGKPSSVA